MLIHAAKLLAQERTCLYGIVMRMFHDLLLPSLTSQMDPAGFVFYPAGSVSDPASSANSVNSKYDAPTAECVLLLRAEYSTVTTLVHQLVLSQEICVHVVSSCSASLFPHFRRLRTCGGGGGEGFRIRNQRGIQYTARN